MKCLMRADLEISFPCSCNCPLYGDCVAACNAEWNAKMGAAAASSPATNADLFREMSDEEQQRCVRRFWEIEDFADWLKQPCTGESSNGH